MEKAAASAAAFYVRKLPVERIPPDKLPHQTGGGDFVVHVRLLNVVQDFDGVAHLVVALVLRLNRGEQGENVFFQHRQLIQRGAVENHVGILLIGENPPLFPPLDAVPHGERMLHRRPPGFVVPDDAPQEPQIAGGNAVVIVQIQWQQRADVKAENQLFVHTFREHSGVQAVKPLHDDDGIRFQTQPFAPPLPLPGEEVEGRKLHFPARQQRRHVLPEQGAVNGVDMLQIQLAVRAGGNFVPVDVIVVQAHEHRLFL